MNAALLAQRLKAMGVPVISSEEPEYHVDGMITVSDRITISVPLEGSMLELLERLDEDTFEHGRRTRNVEQIAQDAKAILARHASEPPAAAG